MERMTRRRAGIIMLVFCLILSVFAIRLYDLQVISTGGKVDNTKTFTIETRVKAARGDLLDRNGNVLVTNRASYDLTFNHYVICSAPNTNALLLEMVNVCREMGIDYIEHFPVTMTTPFTYTLSDYGANWQRYFQAYLPKKGKLDSDISAPLLIAKLRSSYKIPESWSDEDARAVIGIRYELDLRQGITNLPKYVFLEDASTAELAALLELNTPGLTTEASTVREYNTKYAAHILGYIGPITEEQWTKTYKEKEGYAMDALVGQAGLEEAFEEYLHGIDGIRVDVVTVDGTVVDSYYKKDADGNEMRPIAGQNVELSIDLSVQTTAEEQMEALFTQLRQSGENTPEGEDKPDGSDVEGGAVVVMDVKTGQLLACASYPTYDLSTFRQDYNDLLEQDFAPLYNRALQATYPPGSTYKMSMVIAGVDAGIIDKLTTIRDEGSFTKYASSGFRADCLIWSSHHYTHGEINAMEALRDSCNYFFYVLGDQLTIDAIDRTAKGLGLGEKTGIELAEAQGIRANRETKYAYRTGTDRGWYPADQVMTAIGQSLNQFTPIQLCAYTSAIANRGVRYQATFLNRVLDAEYGSVIVENEAKILSQFYMSDEAYEACTEGMRLVITEGNVGRYFRDFPISVAAKTGTAQTDAGNKYSDNGAFVCYAPYEDPEIAIVVYGEKAGHGSTMAQIAKAILETYFADRINGDAFSGENTVS